MPGTSAQMESAIEPTRLALQFGGSESLGTLIMEYQDLQRGSKRIHRFRVPNPTEGEDAGVIAQDLAAKHRKYLSKVSSAQVHILCTSRQKLAVCLALFTHGVASYFHMLCVRFAALRFYSVLSV